jgi:hypothetical protein
MKTFQKSHNVLFLVLIALVMAINSYGYIDMSTGSYVVQLAIAGVLGALFTLRGYAKGVKSKITLFIGGIIKKDKRVQ